MRIIKADEISRAVKTLYIKANTALPEEEKARIRQMYEKETWPTAKESLGLIIENFEMAEKKGLPICQDTGIACVFVEVGNDLHIDGDLEAAVNDGVRKACREAYLRASVLQDPLKRINSGDNTPAMLYTELTSGDKLKISVAPKGAGSENMSQIKMLKPSDGAEGVVDFAVSVVEQAGPNPCPPIVLGVGIGGNFDKAAFIAKKALLRPLGARHIVPFYAAMEEEILRRVNALGIGPEGFGGACTALAVAIETLPCHIASLPCAVNINCHVSRHATVIL